MKIVDFNKYCPSCKYYKESEKESPCNDCLTVSARKNSHKPLKYSMSREKHGL